MITPDPPPKPSLPTDFTQLTREAQLQYLAPLVNLMGKRLYALFERRFEGVEARISELERLLSTLQAEVDQNGAESNSLQRQIHAVDQLISESKLLLANLMADIDGLKRYQSRQGREIQGILDRTHNSEGLFNNALSAIKPALPWLRKLIRAIEEVDKPYDLEAEKRAVDRISRRIDDPGK